MVKPVYESRKEHGEVQDVSAKFSQLKNGTARIGRGAFGACKPITIAGLSQQSCRAAPERHCSLNQGTSITLTAQLSRWPCPPERIVCLDTTIRSGSLPFKVQ